MWAFWRWSWYCAGHCDHADQLSQLALCANSGLCQIERDELCGLHMQGKHGLISHLAFIGASSSNISMQLIITRGSRSCLGSFHWSKVAKSLCKKLTNCVGKLACQPHQQLSEADTPRECTCLHERLSMTNCQYFLLHAQTQTTSGT